MLDQELDALLVGALYGELGPAEEARLAAHLESHPTDRTALDDLRSTRKAFVDSRLFELWFDPPPAVSALLVQEAARRAPKTVDGNESWFARFVRSFVSHPAMAAAAMLVVVVGVAGTLYMKKGADLAEPQAESQVARATNDEVAMAPPAAAAGSSAAIAATTGAATTPSSTITTAQAYGNAKLADNGVPADVDDKVGALHDHEYKPSPPAKPSPTATRAIKGGIEVGAKNYEPKELEKTDYAEDSTRKAPAPASPPEATMATVAPAGASVGGAGPGAATDQKDADTNTWARDQHERVAALVKQSRCTDAAKSAVEIKMRAPDYYDSYVANDRALKDCLSYIANAVERQQSKAAAAKAAKVPPSAASDTK